MDALVAIVLIAVGSFVVSTGAMFAAIRLGTPVLTDVLPPLLARVHRATEPPELLRHGGPHGPYTMLLVAFCGQLLAVAALPGAASDRPYALLGPVAAAVEVVAYATVSLVIFVAYRRAAF